MTTTRNEIFKRSPLTSGADLGDRTSHYCILDEAGLYTEVAEIVEKTESAEQNRWVHPLGHLQFIEKIVK